MFIFHLQTKLAHFVKMPKY